ncbi:hypothetical protein SERIO_v1c06840 [Spiroplasma eriocheiris]|uniref:Uncharacterized protein n=2 Tax=Spiroplasma eriocheiris TaxID=315358 RepID=A0A0H3XL88_9MOLU|nr:hypothetical protein SERIO_v1c06840 [Spiroplasma eriocheiris]
MMLWTTIFTSFNGLILSWIFIVTVFFVLTEQFFRAFRLFLHRLLAKMPNLSKHKKFFGSIIFQNICGVGYLIGSLIFIFYLYLLLEHNALIKLLIIHFLVNMYWNLKDLGIFNSSFYTVLIIGAVELIILLIIQLFNFMYFLLLNLWKFLLDKLIFVSNYLGIKWEHHQSFFNVYANLKSQKSKNIATATDYWKQILIN